MYSYIDQEATNVVRGFIDPFNDFTKSYISNAKEGNLPCPAYTEEDLTEEDKGYIHFNTDTLGRVRQGVYVCECVCVGVCVRV